MELIFDVKQGGRHEKPESAIALGASVRKISACLSTVLTFHSVCELTQEAEPNTEDTRANTPA